MLDSVSGYAVALDPQNDNFLPQPFLFSTDSLNIRTETANLFAIGNALTNKFVVRGNGSWQSADTNGLGGFITFEASTNSGSAVLYVSGSPGSSTVRTNGDGFMFNTPGASDFSFVKGVTSNLTILGVATLNITNGIIMGISGP
jgi:hypothetical protein